MSAVDNAKRFFEKYSKLKRTFEALTIQIEETKQEILHLESISNALDIARHEEDLKTKLHRLYRKPVNRGIK